MADNFQIFIRDSGEAQLQRAIEMAFHDHKATHFIDYPEKGLIFLWANLGGALLHFPKSDCKCTTGRIYSEGGPRGGTVCDDCRGKGYVRSKAGVELFAVPFTHSLSAKDCTRIAQGWLDAQPDERYAEDLNDSDVSQERGWEVYNEEWGKVAGLWQAICAVRPVWMWYGK